MVASDSDANLEEILEGCATVTHVTGKWMSFHVRKAV